MLERKVYGVIMCGGSGTRLWPWSRSSMPKQCLPIIEGDSLMSQSLKRLKKLSKEDVLIVTSKGMGEAISEVLGKDEGCKFLIEPKACNTSMCIGLAAAYVFKNDPSGIVMINTADHDIDEESFVEHAQEAVRYAGDHECVVTFGIKPRYPATVFGYIEEGAKSSFGSEFDFYKVKSFHEKPKKELAKEYIESGKYTWNSGMFLAQAKVLLDEFEKYMPTLHTRLIKMMEADFSEDVVEREYLDMKNEERVQFDIGIAEKSQCFVVIKSDFDWQDVGNWEVLSAMWSKDNDGNVIKGDVLQVDSKNCLIFGKKHVAVLGMEDIVVVNTGDTVLVCPKDRAAEVGGLVKSLKKEGKEELL